MKKIMLLLASACVVAACQYEPVIREGNPSASFDAQAIEAVQGETVTVTGTASDPAGILAIAIKAATWDFSKDIDLSKYTPSEYAFSADVVIPESASVGSGEVTVTVTSAVSGTATASCTITVSEKPAPVVDTEAPVITMNSPATASTEESYAFSLTFSDDVGIIECWPKLHITKGWAAYPTMNGEAYDTNGYSLTVSGKETTFTYDLMFPEGGTYDVIVYDSNDGVSDGIHTLERADDWSIAKFTIEVAYPESSDTDAPVITMNSAASATLGQPYTLSLTFADESGISQCWPLVKVYCGEVLPQEWVDNWNGWWPEVSGTSITVEQAVTFTQAGEYKVWIDPVTDAVGNATEGQDWFTITVEEGSSEPTYLTLDQLPSSLSLSLEGGLATYTLYMKGERTDDTTYTGVEFDLYDSAWNKLVPYGCTNAWDWGEWGMYGKASYQFDKVISFDTAGFYYLYIGEKWGADGYAGHQIDITVE